MSDAETLEPPSEEGTRLSMPNAMAPTATAPTTGIGQVESTHGGSVSNNSSTAVQFTITASLSDGQTSPTTVLTQVVGSGETYTFNPIVEGLAFSNYTGGTDVSFVAVTTLSDGTTAQSDRQPNTVTIP